MAGDSVEREIERFLGFKLPASGGTFGVQPGPRRYESSMAFDAARGDAGRRGDPLSIEAVTGVDLSRIKVMGG